MSILLEVCVDSPSGLAAAIAEEPTALNSVQRSNSAV